MRAAGGIVLTVSTLLIGFSTFYLVAADDPSMAALGPLVTGGIGGLSLAFVGDSVSVTVTQRP